MDATALKVGDCIEYSIRDVSETIQQFLAEPYKPRLTAHGFIQGLAMWGDQPQDVRYTVTPFPWMPDCGWGGRGLATGAPANVADIVAPWQIVRLVEEGDGNGGNEG